MATEIGDLFVRLGLKLDKPSWESAAKHIDELAGMAKEFVSADGLNKLFGMVKEVSGMGDAAVKTAQRVGISVESVQELGYAAGQSGTSIEALTLGVGKLSKSLLDDLEKGKGPSIDALKELGIQSSEVKGLMSGPGGVDDMLGVIAEKFKNMEEGPKKTALAISLFGKAGAQLIPFLNSGAEGIAELRAEAHEFGVVIDEETAKAMESFGDDVDRVHAAGQGLKNELVKQLLPVFQEMVTATLEWVKANREWLSARLSNAVQILIGTFQVLGFVVNKVLGVFEFLRSGTEDAEAVLIAFGAVIATFAVAAAANWVIAFAPIIAVASTIALLGIGIRKLIPYVREVGATVAKYWVGIREEFTRWKDNVIEGVRIIVSTFSGAGESLIAAFAKIKDEYDEWIGNVNAGIERIKEWFAELGRSIQAAWEAALDFVDEKARALLNNPLIRAAMEVSGGAGSTVVADQLMQATPARDGSTQVIPADNRLEARQDVKIENSITVNATPEMAKEELANEITKKIRDNIPAEMNAEWERRMRHADNGGTP